MAIYLDHAATTPLTPAALAAYVEALGVVGNPSSIHTQGQQAKRMLEEARETVAGSLGAEAVEVVFTSGGTESVNLGVKGLFWARGGSAVRPRILVPGGEHHSTNDAVEWLVQYEGAVVEWLPVDALGRLAPSVLSDRLAAGADDVALVSFLWANNEVGTLQPVASLAEVAARYGVPVHVDAVSAYGYVPIDFGALGVAALSVSAHKIGGPVGVGALLLSRRAEVVPLIHGGGQQRGRSGTQDAAGAAAFAAAARAAVEEFPAFADSVGALRDRLVTGIRSAVPTAVLRGDPSAEGRLPGNAHFTFPGCEGDSLLFLLDMAGFSVSTGSACQAGVPEVSHVLTAMGVPESEARGALRITLGHGTTAAEVDALVAALPAAVARASKAGFADRRVA
ncbi:cysteine desulfurase family protein [Subtercola boreus]|uniref:Cysteine desulfurase NifS n=1 Tax=Subtercola boreus TaxID=120213 RepID=A0A3E0WDX1_9MICO|nr:cysteine desulfurase family protein [Subtercola boreus]RFA22049.1 cysteine desulfurase NifS [Subtercola boreus]RFA22229.1 cysteine desulfurase NifS [Subtercola boreus]RFA28092.1 cysteine desulfurase NifS [Subtercola boreus]